MNLYNKKEFYRNKLNNYNYKRIHIKKNGKKIAQ